MRRAARFAFLFVVFGGLLVVQALAPEAFLEIVSVALIVLPITNWTAALLMWRRSRADPSIASLQTASDNSFLLAIASTCIGVVALNRLLTLGIDASLLVVIFAFALLILVIPAIGWLRLLWHLEGET